MFDIRFTPQIPVGQVFITPAAAKRLSLGDVTQALRRHARGDHGDFTEPDRSPAQGAQRRCRVHSAYRATNGTRFWIVTETDLRHTTVMLPEDD
jgi:hypothetical protein